MSNIKEKRIRRFAQKNRHINRQMDIARCWHIKVDSPHKFHKRKATNCGNPNCVMCGNPRKFFEEKTVQEQRFFAEAINSED